MYGPCTFVPILWSKLETVLQGQTLPSLHVDRYFVLCGQ